MNPLLALVLFSSLVVDASGNPMAEAQIRSSKAFQSRNTKQHLCTQNDFDKITNCANVTFAQTGVDMCTILDEVINGCYDRYVGQCLSASKLRDFKDSLVRGLISVQDSNENRRQDKSCPVIQEYLNSGRGSDYVTVYCKQDELDSVRALRDACVEGKVPTYKKEMQRAPSNQKLALLCHHLSELITECVNQLDPCFPDHEMMVIRGNFVVSLASDNPQKLNILKSCLTEVS